MLSSRKTDLAIYQMIRHLKPGLTTSLAILHVCTGEDYATLVERLKALEAEGRIILSKYAREHLRQAHLFANHSPFVYVDCLEVRIVPTARAYFEELEQEAEREPRMPVIFISCGQCSSSETELGKALAAKVSELTPCQGYFAGDPHPGMAGDTFRKRNECARFVGVLHYRDEETLERNEHTPISNWDQFVRAVHLSLRAHQEHNVLIDLGWVQARDIPVLLYIQRGIEREGFLEYLKLSLIDFDSEAEVLADFESRLRSGAFRP